MGFKKIEVQNIRLKILFYTALCLAGISLYFGLRNLISFGVDCQIEGAGYFMKSVDPYELVLKDAHYFRNSRWPTLLPQGYFLLAPFALFSDSVGYFLFGFFSIAFTLLALRKEISTDKDNFLVLLLMFCTVSYRNNLGNGQIGILLFPFFIIFHRIISRQQRLASMDILLGAVQLLLLASKPTLYFWVPFVYLIRAKRETVIDLLKIGIVYFILQILSIIFFAILVNASPLTVIENYVKVLHILSWQMYDGSSYLNFNLVDSNYFVIVLIPLVTFFSFHRKLEIRIFSLAILSFFIVYHKEYDLFIVLIPFLIVDPLKLKSQWLLLLIMIFERVFFSIYGTWSYLPRYFISVALIVVFIEILMTDLKNKRIVGVKEMQTN